MGTTWQSPKHCNISGDSSTSASPTLRMTLVGADDHIGPHNMVLFLGFAYAQNDRNLKQLDKSEFEAVTIPSGEGA